MSDNIFGSRLKELRERSGLKKSQCERKVGYSKDTFWRWENGKTIPNGKALIDLATFFNVSIDYLLGLTDKKERLK